jgi:hypothetical protein
MDTTRPAMPSGTSLGGDRGVDVDKRHFPVHQFNVEFQNELRGRLHFLQLQNCFYIWVKIPFSNSASQPHMQNLGVAMSMKPFHSSQVCAHGFFAGYYDFTTSALLYFNFSLPQGEARDGTKVSSSTLIGEDQSDAQEIANRLGTYICTVHFESLDQIY